MDCSTEMSVYHKGRLNPASAPDMPSSARNWDCDDPENGLSAASGGKPKQDGSMRRRQKVEADTADSQGDFLADPIKAIKSLLPRAMSSTRVNMDTSSRDWSQKSSSISFLNGFRSVRKSPSAPTFADTENGTSSMWSSSTWTFNHESFTRPLLDGLPKPVSTTRRAKTATDWTKHTVGVLQISMGYLPCHRSVLVLDRKWWLSFRRCCSLVPLTSVIRICLFGPSLGKKCTAMALVTDVSSFFVY